MTAWQLEEASVLHLDLFQGSLNVVMRWLLTPPTPPPFATETSDPSKQSRAGDISYSLAIQVTLPLLPYLIGHRGLFTGMRHTHRHLGTSLEAAFHTPLLP